MIWTEDAMNYLLYSTQTCKAVRRHVVCYCISKIKNEFRQNLGENSIWTWPGLYTVVWTDMLTTKNTENINVKYNIKIQNRLLTELGFFFNFGKFSSVSSIFLHFCPSKSGRTKGGDKNNTYLSQRRKYKNSKIFNYGSLQKNILFNRTMSMYFFDELHK